MKIQNIFKFGLLICFISVLGCSKDKEDGGDKDKAKPPQEGGTPPDTHLKGSAKPGMFPDGSAAAPLSEEETALFVKNISNAELIQNVFSELEGTAAFASGGEQFASLAGNILSADEKDQKNKLTEQENQLLAKLKKQCDTKIVQEKPTKTGEANNETVTQKAQKFVKGEKCPMGSKMAFELVTNIHKLGYNYSVSKKLTASYNTEIKEATLKDELQLVTQQHSFTIDQSNTKTGPTIIDNLTMEIVSHAMLPNNQMMNLQTLMSLHVERSKEESQVDSTYSDLAAPKVTVVNLKFATVVDAVPKKAILQVFGKMDRAKKISEMVIYLNGKALSEDEAKKFTRHIPTKN